MNLQMPTVTVERKEKGFVQSLFLMSPYEYMGYSNFAAILFQLAMYIEIGDIQLSQGSCP